MPSCKQLTRLSLSVLFVSLAFSSFGAEADPNVYVASTTDDVVSVVNAATHVVVATIPVGDSPWRVALTQDGSRAYVTNAGSDSVSVIDTTTNTVMATVSVAQAPSAVAVTPDGAEVYLQAAGGVLQVIDTAVIGTATDSVIATMSFGPPFESQTSIAILPDGTRAYAVASGALQVIDTATLTVQSSLDVGSSPSQLALSPDGTRAYVTNSFRDPDLEFGLDGQVVVVDTATNSVLDTISLFTLPGSIAVTPDGTRAYVASAFRFWNSGYGQGFLPDSSVAVIDLEAGVVSSWILVPGTAAGMAVTPDGSLVYVAIPGADSLSVIDTDTDTTVATTIGVAAEPRGLAIGVPREPLQTEIASVEVADTHIDADQHLGFAGQISWGTANEDAAWTGLRFSVLGDSSSLDRIDSTALYLDRNTNARLDPEDLELASVPGILPGNGNLEFRFDEATLTAGDTKSFLVVLETRPSTPGMVFGGGGLILLAWFLAGRRAAQRGAAACLIGCLLWIPVSGCNSGGGNGAGAGGVEQFQVQLVLDQPDDVILEGKTTGLPGSLANRPIEGPIVTFQ
jgi:YVTN family beta-propeller protein